MTIQLYLNECGAIKQNLHVLRNEISPAEIRIKKTINQKEGKDLQHPFYYIPNYTKDIMLIGYAE